MRYPLMLESTSANDEESESNEEKWKGVRDVWEGEMMKKLKVEDTHQFLLS